MTKQNHASASGSPPDAYLIAHYAMACLEGTPDTREWADLQRHLAVCPTCQEELADLLSMLADASITNLAELETPVAFDLSGLPPWLPPAQTDAMPGGALLIVKRAFNHARRIALDLGTWLDEATSPPASLAGAFRAGGPPGEYHYQIQVDRPDNIDIALDLIMNGQNQSQCRLKVTVIATDDPFAQGGHRLTLQYDAQLCEAITDTRGCAVFADVPLAAFHHLQLTVHLCELDSDDT